MSVYRWHVRKLDEVVAQALQLADGKGTIVEGEVGEAWAKVKLYVEALFERAPFHVGDRVALARSLTEEHRYWTGDSRDFIVEGATAVVDGVDFSASCDRFLVWVTFDGDPLRGQEGGERHLHFWEDELRLVTHLSVTAAEVA